MKILSNVYFRPPYSVEQPHIEGRMGFTSEDEARAVLDVVSYMADSSGDDAATTDVPDGLGARLEEQIGRIPDKAKPLKRPNFVPVAEAYMGVEDTTAIRRLLGACAARGASEPGKREQIAGSASHPTLAAAALVGAMAEADKQLGGLMATWLEWEGSDYTRFLQVRPTPGSHPGPEEFGLARDGKSMEVLTSGRSDMYPFTRLWRLTLEGYVPEPTRW